MKKKLVIILWLVLVTVSFLLGTELFAFLLKNSSMLGVRYFTYVHEPFHIVYWFIKYDLEGLYYPLCFSIILFFILLSSFLCVLLLYRKSKNVSDNFGSSEWAVTNELKKDNLLQSKGVICGQTDDAVLIGKTKMVKEIEEQKESSDKKEEDKQKQIVKMERKTVWKQKKQGQLIASNDDKHTLVVAPTRGGKGINTGIPTLLTWLGSVVIFDRKRECWEITAGWRRKFSHVFCFEPSNPNSIKFNPLFEIEKGSQEVEQTQTLLYFLVNPSGEKNTFDFWDNSCVEFLTAVILHVLYAEDNKSLRGVYNYINNPKRGMYEMLDYMAETKHKLGETHITVAQIAKSFSDLPETTLSNIIKSANTYLITYQDQIVGENTSTSDFRIKDLMNAKRPVCLYIVAGETRLKPLVRLLLQMIGTKLTKTKGHYKHPLLFLLDEFPTLGKMEFFEDQLAYFAGFGIKCCLICQSFNQLYKHYGERTSIPDNCSNKIILGADGIKDAEIISKYLGQKTIKVKSVTRSTKTEHITHNNQSVSESEKARDLMTPNEVLQLPYSDVIILLSRRKPYRAKKIMYYLDDRFKHRKDLPVPDNYVEQKMECIETPVDISWTRLEAEFISPVTEINNYKEDKINFLKKLKANEYKEKENRNIKISDQPIESNITDNNEDEGDDDVSAVLTINASDFL